MGCSDGYEDLINEDCYAINDELNANRNSKESRFRPRGTTGMSEVSRGGVKTGYYALDIYRSGE